MLYFLWSIKTHGSCCAAKKIGTSHYETLYHNSSMHSTIIPSQKYALFVIADRIRDTIHRANFIEFAINICDIQAVKLLFSFFLFGT